MALQVVDYKPESHNRPSAVVLRRSSRDSSATSFAPKCPGTNRRGAVARLFPSMFEVGSAKKPASQCARGRAQRSSSVCTVRGDACSSSLTPERNARAGLRRAALLGIRKHSSDIRRRIKKTGLRINFSSRITEGDTIIMLVTIDYSILYIHTRL